MTTYDVTIRCEHDLHPAACVTCAEPAGHWIRRVASPGPRFTAARTSECVGCHDLIRPGDDARGWERGYWHARCAERAAP